jgi:mannose-6-phosphate isomerase
LPGGGKVRPYKTNPVIVERVWGGSKLCEYNKRIQGNTIGESWETGPLEGNTPILIKFIDARETLSVQVHPDDKFASEIENAQNGKSEAWVVLECEEDAFIIYGFNRPLRKEELMGLLEKESVAEVLNYVKVKKGDCIYIPAGTVHSLGKGILAYEVQQPSDLTYRIYDWDRKDIQGKGRELHIDKAVAAINYSSKLPQITNIYDSLKGNFFNIINCKHFESSYRFLRQKESQKYEQGRFRVVTMVSGSAVLNFEDSLIMALKGDTFIVPKEYDGTISIEGLEAAEYIVTTCNI